MLGESFEYAKDAVWGRWTRWLLLMISTVIFPLMAGYVMEIYRGKKPAPEPAEWLKMFIDGLKLIVAAIIYAIPVLIVLFATIGYAVLGVLARSPGGYDPNYFTMHPELIMSVLPGLFLGLVITVIVGFIIALFATVAMVRLARTGRFGEAFNFGEIAATIRRIGWGAYIGALIVIWIVVFVFSMVLSVFWSIPWIGWLIWLFLLVPVSIFQARYIAQVYDAGEPVVSSAPVSPAPA